MPYVGKTMDRKRNARRRQLNGAHTAASWNAEHPVGTAVRYWPIYPPIESVPPLDTTTRRTSRNRSTRSLRLLTQSTEGRSLTHPSES